MPVPGTSGTRWASHARRCAADGASWGGWVNAVARWAEAAAEAEFRKALKSAPVPPEARVALQDRFGAQRGGTRPATGGMKLAAIRRLLSLIQSGRMAEAERLASAALKQHPGSALALNVPATAPARQGKAAPAEAPFLHALAVDESGGIVVDKNQMTTLDRVFSGGDQVRGALLLRPDHGHFDEVHPLVERIEQPGPAENVPRRAAMAGQDRVGALPVRGVTAKARQRDEGRGDDRVGARDRLVEDRQRAGDESFGNRIGRSEAVRRSVFVPVVALEEQGKALRVRLDDLDRWAESKSMPNARTTRKAG